MGSGNKIKIGLKWSLAQVVCRNLLSVGATAILARLLTPEDYGVFGMAATFIAVMHALTDMGLSWATISGKDVSEQQYGNLFWLNIACGSVVLAACVLSAGFIADFFRESRLIYILYALGLVFLVSSASSQPIAILKRNFRQKEVALIEVVSASMGSLSGIIIAIMEGGYWALVVQVMIGSAVKSFLAIYISGVQILPPKAIRGTLDLVKFGGSISVAILISKLSQSADSIFVGKLYRAADLGIYTRAQFLMWLPTWTLSGVLTGLMVPAMSRSVDNRDKFSSTYQDILFLISWIIVPLSVGLAVTSREVVTLLYGEKWIDSAVILSWLSLSAIAQPIYLVIGWKMIALKKARGYIILNILLFSGAIVALLFSYDGGLVEFSRNYGIIMGPALLPLAVCVSHYFTEIPVFRCFKNLLVVFALSMSMAVSVIALRHFIPAQLESPATSLPIQVFVGVMVYLLLSYIFVGGKILDAASSFFGK